MEKILLVDTGEGNLDGQVQFVDVVLLSAHCFYYSSWLQWLLALFCWLLITHKQEAGLILC